MPCSKLDGSLPPMNSIRINRNAIVAIDPGAYGYLCAVHIENQKPRIEFSHAIYGYRKMDGRHFSTILDNYLDSDMKCIIEEPIPASIHRNTMATLTQGVNFGFVLALLKDHFNEVVIIKPSDWQGALGVGRSDTKHRASIIAKQLFGEAAIIPQGCRTPHEGLVDASLIGYYGSLNLKELFKEDEK